MTNAGANGIEERDARRSLPAAAEFAVGLTGAGHDFDQEMIGGESIASALWPLHKQNGIEGRLIEREFRDLVPTGQPIEVGVLKRETPAKMLVEEHERRTGDDTGNTQPTSNSLCEDGLSRAKISGEQHHGTCRSQPAQAFPERTGLLGSGSLETPLAGGRRVLGDTGGHHAPGWLSQSDAARCSGSSI